MAGATRLAERLLRGERAALSKAITLVESTAARSRPAADALLDRTLSLRAAAASASDGAPTSATEPSASRGLLRIGISGPPGAGKSTLIEALGMEMVNRGHRLAVLTVDPSSAHSGGSVLGDKTRMQKLSADRRAFVRPSPACGHLGGVARRTHDAMALCESAGFDRLVVETVGVGQSEVAVASLVDVFVLLVPPAAGDELQGIKRGIMELTDIVIVTKADGRLRAAAGEAARQLRAALKVLRPPPAATASAASPAWKPWTPIVLEVSSIAAANSDLGALEAVPTSSNGASDSDRTSGAARAPNVAATASASKSARTPADVADVLEAFHEATAASGQLLGRRRTQAVSAVQNHAWTALVERMGRSAAAEQLIASLAVEVASRRLAVSAAAERVADALLAPPADSPKV